LTGINRETARKAKLKSTMFRRRLHRIAIATLAVLSLLFSQLALASYVCPQQKAIETMAAMMEAGQPCEGMDSSQPALCHQHSADPARAPEAVKLPTAAQPAVVQVLELPAVSEASTVGVVVAFGAPEARPPPAPLFLSTLRLRV
jgi:hypothetical protein